MNPFDQVIAYLKDCICVKASKGHKSLSQPESQTFFLFSPTQEIQLIILQMALDEHRGQA